MEQEPFLMNPYVGIINHPQRSTTKKGKVTMARKSSKAHMAYVRSFRKSSGKKRAPARRKRRAARRNPYPIAGLALNPRRRRKARRSHAVARRRHSRGFSRNPRVFGVELPPMNKVLFAGIGFVTPPMVEGLVSGFIPASIQSTTIGKYAVRIGIVAAIGYAIGRFLGREKGNMALIGGGVYIATTAAMEFVPSIFGASVPVIPAASAPKLSGYVDGSTVRGYVPANQRLNSALGYPSTAWANTESTGAQGGVAARFKKI